MHQITENCVLHVVIETCPILKSGIRNRSEKNKLSSLPINIIVKEEA